MTSTAAATARRIAALRRAFLEEGLDGFLILSLERSDEANLRYLTGFSGSFGLLIVTASRAVFLTDSRYFERAKDLLGSSNLELEVEVEQTRGLWHETPVEALRGLGVKRLGLGAARTSVQAYHLLCEKLEDVDVELVPMDGLVEGLRWRKDPQEIACIERAQELTDRAFAYIAEKIAPGRSEAEIAWELEVYLRRNGSEGLAFPVTVASGPHSALPHYETGSRRLQPGDLVWLDFGARVEGYCADMTRTLCLGPPSEEQKQIYRIVLEAQERALAALEVGVSGKAVDEAARSHIEAAGHKEHFGHGTGHGVGLEVHEGPVLSPLRDDELPRGAVVTVEPGVYLPGWGGVRIEDLVVVEEGGCRNLTRSPKALMSL